ncbi:DNA polymerase III subunit chi [Candidatus Williamhamiltonella defendens]|uniref:DNA polymerase III subunit chi n=1 Tax=Candidatus Hamiltonella defensa (Bemisia tabaci) TaxID=672795 RepID=A0A249DXU8_9ENTR|nr:DNA polymerase III subunit chi [Candidatus Hamiltonella defensa]ASX26358.1 DNA polymerase III subunit chi [Candidatus Hamiltonella defensa (Bemisia tabaci)]CED78323.1 DNA polymerase III subunit chi [Candidatus Hamiltonella defensa (Bemisia tabaci)]
MKRATFYLMEHGDPIHGLSPEETLTCELSAQHWRAGKKIQILCEEKAQAARLDDALWLYPPDAFIPHDLSGEGPKQGAPVEIIWPDCLSHHSADLLINLLSECIDFVGRFTEIIDFVPYETTLKQLARARYAYYRQLGFHLITTSPPLSK